MRLRVLHGWRGLTCVLIASSPVSTQRSGVAFAALPEPSEDTQVQDTEFESPPTPAFSFRASDFKLELDGSYQDRRVRSHRDDRRDSTQRNRDWRFDETVSLRLDGHVVDPRVIRWDARLQFGLSQEDALEEYNGITRNDYDSGSLLEYDLNVDLFPDEPLSGRIYALKGRDRLPRRFLPSLLEERSQAGAAAFWSSGKWTGELSLDWSDIDRTGNQYEYDDEHLQATRLTLDNRWEISDRQSLRVVFDHEREESDYEGTLSDFDTNRDEFRVEHELALGDKGQHQLSSLFRYHNEKGDLARDEIEAGTKLTLRHNDQWQTAYRYWYYSVDQDDVDTNRNKGDFQATYKPNDRWRLTFDAFALREAIEHDIEAHQFGGGFDVSHNQPTEWGEFRGNLSFQADQWRTLDDAGKGVILGEAHALDTVRASILREHDVVPGSIRVFNATRTRMYIPGRDYQIVTSGRLTSVYLILSGNIPEGDVVYIDYNYVIPSGSRVDTYRADLRLEHAFRNGLTPYYSFDLRRQDASGSPAVPEFTDNTERHRLGTRYERPRWSAGLEFELVHDSVEPYDAFHSDLRVALLRNADYQLDGNVRFSNYDFEGDRPRRVHWFEIDATNSLRISQYLTSMLKAAYRWEDNTLDGLTEGIDLECGLEYQRGALHVELIFEYDSLDIDQSDDHGFGIWLNIRRDLSHLLASGARRQ